MNDISNRRAGRSRLTTINNSCQKEREKKAISSSNTSHRPNRACKPKDTQCTVTALSKEEHALQSGLIT